MVNKKEILKYLNISNTPVLTYSFKYERKKDEFLSNLNHILYDGCNLEAIIRNEKINNLLDIKYYEWVVCDVNDILINSPIGNQTFLSKSKIVKSIISNLDVLSKKKLLTTPTYQSSSKLGGILGGTDIIYRSDFIFNIDDKITIIKNRYGMESPFTMDL